MAETPPATPLVIDCDPGADDALALLMALAAPSLDLRFVTVVAGNAPVDVCAANARRVLDLAGRADITVHRGAAAPLCGGPVEDAVVHGADGLAGLALPLALLALPVILAAAAWIRLSSPGPAFFAQERVGRHEKPFRCLKLRSMRHGTLSLPTHEVGAEAVTPAGRTLRRLKLDELPQLWNVVRGEMSLVGPRPDVPEYLERIRREAPLVLAVRPGLTGPASIKYRREEALLAAQRDPQDFNDRVLFPDKLRINEAYVLDFRLVRDLQYLWQTVWPPAAIAEADNPPPSRTDAEAA